VLTLVVVEERGGRATPDSLALLGLARGLGGEVQAAVLGHGVAEAAHEAARHGASIVHAVDDPALAEPLAEPHVRIVERLVRELEADAVLLATTVLAADVAGGLAAALDAGLNWDLGAVAVENGRLVGERLALGESMTVRVGWVGAPCVGLVRPGIAQPVPVDPPGAVVAVPLGAGEARSVAEVVSREVFEEAGPSLEEAEVVVAGGKGLGAAENFALVEALAEALGGAVGATRAVVELGWYPQSAQVGQTGKSVAPRLYVACGISGAIHHKIGMHRSEVVVAVNTDRSAPIFDVCDLGVVGDATRFLPELTELVLARRGDA
jgi:electron transfer flavoprotein alpha subunit